MSHRILYVIDSLHPLGEAFQLTALVPHLANDIEVHVAVLTQSAADFCPLAGTNVKVHFLGASTTTAPRPLSDLVASAWRVRALAEVVRPTIVHPWGASAEQVVGVARSLRSPALKTASVVCTHVAQLPKLNFLSDQWMGRSRAAFRHVVLSHSALEPVVRAAGYSDAQTVVVPNAAIEFPSAHDRGRLIARLGLDDHLDGNEPLDGNGPPGRRPVIAATAANLIPATRLKDLIWATDLLTCIRDDFHLVIFGAGEGRQALERFAGFTVAKSHVHFIEDADAWPLLAAVDVYWHSHLQMPLPSPMLAAMASAIPVISVYGDGTREAIRHQETGMAVNFGARDEFARWTKFLIEKPESAKQLAAQGRAFALENFSLQSMVDGYRAIYGRLTSN